MQHTPSDTSPRNAYAERTIATALDTLSLPQVQDELGVRAVELTRMLSAAVITNIVDNQVRLPTDYQGQADVLPIAVVRKGEVLTMSDFFEGQTTAQKFETMNVFEGWGPRPNRLAQIYRRVWGPIIDKEGQPTMAIEEAMVAVTGVNTIFLSARDLHELFAYAPDKGFAAIKMRPCLFLNMEPENDHTQPDAVAHELVHVAQFESKPVHVVSSQRAAEMWTLRQELEAYCLGAYFTVVRAQNPQDKTWCKTEAETEFALVQLIVEHIRAEVNTDPYDPFRPSPRILRALQDANVGNILHTDYQYEKIAKLLEKVDAERRQAEG